MSFNPKTRLPKGRGNHYVIIISLKYLGSQRSEEACLSVCKSLQTPPLFKTSVQVQGIDSGLYFLYHLQPPLLTSSLCVCPSLRTTSSSFKLATLHPQPSCLLGPTIARIRRSSLVSPTTHQIARASSLSLEVSSKGGRNSRHNALRRATHEQGHCYSLRLQSSKPLWQSAEGIYLCLLEP